MIQYKDQLPHMTSVLSLKGLNKHSFKTQIHNSINLGNTISLDNFITKLKITQLKARDTRNFHIASLNIGPSLRFLQLHM